MAASLSERCCLDSAAPCNLQSPWFPLYDKITPDNLVTSLTSLFAELDSSIDHLEGSHYASWQDTVDPFEEISDRMNVAWAVVDHLQVRSQSSRGRHGIHT